MKNWFTSLTLYVDSNNKIFYQRKIQFSLIAHNTCKNTCKNVFKLTLVHVIRLFNVITMYVIVQGYSYISIYLLLCSYLYND